MDKKHVGKSNRIRQIESQSDQSKTVLALRNKKKLQSVENIALRTAVDAPWYVRNVDIQRDLKFTTAT